MLSTNTLEDDSISILDAISPLYTYDPRTGRHRNKSTGRLVSLKEIEKELNKLIEQKKKDLFAVSRYLMEGSITLDNWERTVAETIKTIQLQYLILEKGGINNVTPEDTLAIGRNLKNEYSYLNKFAKQLKAGQVTEKQMFARIKKYVDNTAVAKAIAQRQKKVELGDDWALRKLGANENHCPACPNYAGIFPARLVVMPGERCPCGKECKCSVEFFKGYPDHLSEAA